MSNLSLLDRKSSEIKYLADSIFNIENVKKYCSDQHDEATTLAHAVVDIEKSCSILLNNSIPKLFDKTLSTEKKYDLLLDIGEELRHILYHINDSRFYNYLTEE